MSILRRTTMMAVVLGGLLLGGAAPMHAHRYGWCEQRINEAERDVRRAVRRHGEGSPQAEMRRSRLHELMIAVVAIIGASRALRTRLVRG